jgi:hypothetical protein
VITLAKLFLDYDVYREIKRIPVAITKEEYELFSNSSSNQFFEKQNNTLRVKSYFFREYKKVKDKYRYNLISKSNAWLLTKTNGQPIQVPPSKDDISREDQDIPETDENTQVILVVLESPHKKEYSEDGFFKPLSPANGTTGVNFYKYFTTCVLPILTYKGLILNPNMKYKIFFVNPVPFQTSLYEIHKINRRPKNLPKNVLKELRDKIWRALYPELEQDFKARVISYSPNIILNGCTSELKDAVKATLGSIQFVQMFKMPHPSDWARIFNQFSSY